MKKFTLLFLLFCLMIQSVEAQMMLDTFLLNADLKKLSDAPTEKYPSPYKTTWKGDGAIILGGVALTGLGSYLIGQKKDRTTGDIAAMSKNDIPFFDRGNAGFYSEKADRDSYIPFQYSFALPVLTVLANKNQRQNAFQVLALYTETMAVTGALFSMTTGTVYRSRPYVYGNIADLSRKMDNDSYRSFYAGHTAATAAATFYWAKTFQDFNPDSKLKPYVWVVAATVPAVVGFLRYKAGMHFLSDNLLGYGMGAAAGILVPHWHKTLRVKNLSFVPEAGKNYKGVSFVYKL